jgi:hypothetical protein
MNYLEQIDNDVLERIYSGRSLSDLEQITDWPTYFAGFVKRQAPNSAILSALYATTETLCWSFSFWFEMSAKYFLFEQAQAHVDLLHALNRLKLAICFTLEVGIQSERGYVEAYEIELCAWDIENVNSIKRTMENFITFSALVPEFQDDYGVISALSNAETKLEAFYSFYPQFCKILDDNNFLHLTEKIVRPEPLPELEVEMSDPNNYHAFEAFESQRMATDFQGFVVGKVLEPGTEDGPRDLHNQWISKEEIEKAALYWSIHGRKIRVQHDESTEALNGEHPDFLCVFNWIQRGDTTIGGYEVKDGTWMQAWQAMSETAKAKLYNREITCFSPGSMMRVKRDKE